jgi:hypothetical protein
LSGAGFLSVQKYPIFPPSGWQSRRVACFFRRTALYGRWQPEFGERLAQRRSAKVRGALRYRKAKMAEELDDLCKLAATLPFTDDAK